MLKAGGKNLFDDEEDLTEEIKKNSEKGKNFYDNIIINAINKNIKDSIDKE